MIRLGILDFDTSHCVAFTQRLNHKEVAEDQWVNGAEVVIGCPGESKIQPERIPGHTAALEKVGIKVVNKPEEMIGRVDGMLIESQQGGVHFDRARPFLEAGIPCFIDKPLACSVADARKIIDLADRRNTPIFSASAMRYAPEAVAYMHEGKHGKVLGAFTYGPAPLHDGNPGLYHYGIHAVELLYTLMGPGCKRVSCSFEKEAEVVTGQWRDGRVGSVRGARSGGREYGFIAFAENGVRHVSVGVDLVYRELLKQIVKFFETRKAPVPIADTFEIIAFLEAALKSTNNHGAGEHLAV